MTSLAICDSVRVGVNWRGLLPICELPMLLARLLREVMLVVLEARRGPELGPTEL